MIMARKTDSPIVSVVHAVCCGLDVHKDAISACLVMADYNGVERSEIREFGTVTEDLLGLRNWLMEHDCPIVAMESTGVYWWPVHNVLEHYIEVILVNARHIKNVPGRKTDIADSKWLAGLLRHGLLKGSFIPPQYVRDWRDLTRLRKKIQENINDYKRRIHKVFESANIKLGSMISDVFGVTGNQLMDLLVSHDKELTLEEIEKCLQGRLKSTPIEIFRSIQGSFRDHHRYLLKKLRQIIQVLKKERGALTQRLQELMEPYNPLMKRLKAVPGISDVSAAIILSEIGPTLDKFSSNAALASWSGLCPGNNESAGKRKSGRNPVRQHRLRTVMVEVAWGAIRKKGSYYKDKFHRLKARRGPKKALVAIAHRLLKAIYHIIKTGEEFRDLGENYLLLRHQTHKLRYLKQQAQVLGYELTPIVV
jgi:transposase